MYCGEHKKLGMVDVKNKICLDEGCTKQPYFNNLGEIQGMYCGNHKKLGMVDVKNKKCC